MHTPAIFPSCLVPDLAGLALVCLLTADCKGGAFTDKNRTCPHSNRWLYTPLDAYLGQACQVRGQSVAM